jgi:CheY-like chemotaxis protein
MPNLTGTEATKRIREHGYAGKIVGMTGDPIGCLERAEFESAGLDVCVNKDSQGVQLIVRELKALLEQPAGIGEHP